MKDRVPTFQEFLDEKVINITPAYSDMHKIDLVDFEKVLQRFPRLVDALVRLNEKTEDVYFISGTLMNYSIAKEILNVRYDELTFDDVTFRGGNLAKITFALHNDEAVYASFDSHPSLFGVLLRKKFINESGLKFWLKSMEKSMKKTYKARGHEWVFEGTNLRNDNKKVFVEIVSFIEENGYIQVRDMMIMKGKSLPHGKHYVDNYEKWGYPEEWVGWALKGLDSHNITTIRLALLDAGYEEQKITTGANRGVYFTKPGFDVSKISAKRLATPEGW